MESRIDKITVAKNFSKNAAFYDNNSSVQSAVASMLVKKLPSCRVGSILEIGCGTGNYTRLLRDVFKANWIKAIDISEEMVGIARGKIKDEKTYFVVSDVETIDFNEKFSLITSNATFHWFYNLETAIERLQKALTEDGMMVFSIFGPKTFVELKKSVSAVLRQDIPMVSDFFNDKEKINAILEKYFKDVHTTECLLGKTYLSLGELLKKIKYSGTRGNGKEFKRVWSRELVKKIEKEYRERFGAIKATYQVFFCEVKCKM